MNREERLISIHALREEGDLRPCAAPDLALQFLSTPSARRATRGCAGTGRPSADFYPRPPRGGRRAHVPLPTLRSNFYPRPPRGGRRSYTLKG